MPARGEHIITFEKAIAFPGLINSHDHLDFNLFPLLGNRIYNSYVEWGADIQTRHKETIAGILAIPKQLRTQWGIYKNLLNGITTVVNHGVILETRTPLINVFQNNYSLHSVRREKLWKLKLNRPFAKPQPFVVHAGEGTDGASLEEINELLKWNLFKRKLIAVHGVAMNAKQARAFEAVVWCPASNFFLLNATAKLQELKGQTSIIFGTDSTLTASWNIWEHFRQARETKLLTDKELFEIVTINPAKTWGMRDAGELAEGRSADIVVARPALQSTQWDQFYNLNPENILLIIHQGKIRLFDAELTGQIRSSVRIDEFSRIFTNKSEKYVQGHLSKLMRDIRKYKPDLSFPIDCD